MRQILPSLLLLVIALPAASHERVFASQDFFYVGGKYFGDPGKEQMTGQMYVEVLRPVHVTRKYPIIFIPGGKMTATPWMSTPDRMGWADYFLGQGYLVYLVDPPARGRSTWHPSLNGPLSTFYAPDADRRMTRTEDARQWPQATKHTQWPSEGEARARMGDRDFDQFFAMQVDTVASTIEVQTLAQAAGIALMDKIGPAVLIGHSQAGPAGWLLADNRPSLVKGIIAIEPSGPPFRNVVVKEDPRPWGLTWGITDLPLTYSPPVEDPSELVAITQTVPDGPDLSACWMQAEPPRQLPNLQHVPIAIVSSDSSFTSPYNHCMSRFLTQAGVNNTFIRLDEHGLPGYGHMMMIEKNNLKIAALLNRWILQNVK
jgi:pimeloyl-ACP methyl ester carboxylesterase